MRYGPATANKGEREIQLVKAGGPVFGRSAFFHCFSFGPPFLCTLHLLAFLLVPFPTAYLHDEGGIRGLYLPSPFATLFAVSSGCVGSLSLSTPFSSS